MRYEDTEFDPATDADREAAAREAELARKIRREVLRVQRGEALVFGVEKRVLLCRGRPGEPLRV